jgi:hypothetical protein
MIAATAAARQISELILEVVLKLLLQRGGLSFAILLSVSQIYSRRTTSLAFAGFM